MTFDPKSKVKSIQGKDYLEVKWRIYWFREDHPRGGIITEIAQAEPMLVKASIIDEEGRTLGTGYGSPKMQGVSKSRPVEGAETAAIGRALAHAGYGTQFTGEDEEDHLADSPIEKEETKDVSILGGDTIKKVVELGIFEAEQAAAQVLSRLFPGQRKASLDKIVELSKKYRSYKTETGDTDKAIELTLGEK